MSLSSRGARTVRTDSSDAPALGNKTLGLALSGLPPFAPFASPDVGELGRRQGCNLC